MLKKVNRQWGYWIELWRSKRFCVKILAINPMSFMSLQRHKQRNEVLIKISGHPQNGSKLKMVSMIKKNQLHRLSSITKSYILEIQYGENVSEEDIERF
jgi:hypothetical protein